MKTPQGENSRSEKKNREWLRVAGMGSELAGSIVGGTLLGWWIDWKFQTAPTGILVGSLIGIVGGFYNFIRRAHQVTVQQRRARERAAAKLAGKSGDPGSEHDQQR